MLNAALALFLLSFLTPLLTHLGQRSRTGQAAVVMLAVPVMVVALLCTASALRPGSLARMARRRGQRRSTRG